jgi:hypothetical protein
MKSQYRILFAFIVLLVAMSCVCNSSSLTPSTPPTAAPVATDSAAPTANVPQPPTNGTSSDLVTFTDQNNWLAFDLPGDWTHDNIKSDDGFYYVDKFAAPDSTAKMDSLVYNDGIVFSGKDNGKWALGFLNSDYSNTGKVGDIRISSDQIMKDGSDRLEWVSKSGGYSGVSYFEVRGTDHKTFLMLTAWWVDGVDKAVLDAVNNAIASYRVP